MIIGDKVRMLHGNGEGVVIRMEGDRVTVMLNEGLEIPVARKHLVSVRQMKEDLPAQKTPDRNLSGSTRPVPGMLFLTEGVYLAGIPSGGMQLEFHIVNQTDFELFVLVYKLARPVNQFHTQIQLTAKSAVALPGSFPRQESNHLTGLAFQVLKFHPGRGDIQSPTEFRLSFSRLPGKSAIQRIPVLETEGLLIQMDEKSVEPDPESLKEALFSGRNENRPETGLRSKNSEIDLHVEKLCAESEGMSSGEILSLQLKCFDKAMDDALLSGQEQLIVIHGVGNGVLRAEIHRRLAMNRNIRHFKDARREKFGYGATEIAF